MDNKAVIEIQTKMKTWTDAGIELAYNSGYEQGCKDRDEIYTEDKEDYNRGLNEAWECARKINKMTMGECEKVFGECRYLATILQNFTVSEAITKIKEYEQTKEMSMKEAIYILDHLKSTDTKESFDAYRVGKALTMATKSMEYINDHYYEGESE